MHVQFVNILLIRNVVQFAVTQLQITGAVFLIITKPEESELAKELNIDLAGEYCLRVR